MLLKLSQTALQLLQSLQWPRKLGIRPPQLSSRQRVRFLRRFRFTRIGGGLLGSPSW